MDNFRVLLTPRISCSHFFYHTVFFPVTHNGRSKRGTTCSLDKVKKFKFLHRFLATVKTSNRIDRKAVFTKFVLLKPWSQQNPLLFLKIQASNEIICCEMHRTDQQTPRRLSLLNSLHNSLQSRNRPIACLVSSLQADHL